MPEPISIAIKRYQCRHIFTDGPPLREPRPRRTLLLLPHHPPRRRGKAEYIVTWTTYLSGATKFQTHAKDDFRPNLAPRRYRANTVICMD